MVFIDIVFPLNLPPLTYLCPEELQSQVKPGKLVSAPLKKKIEKGIIYKIRSEKSEIRNQNLKRIEHIHGAESILTNEHIRLMEWMKDYYYSEMGLILKSMLPGEFFKEVKRRTKKKPLPDAIEFKPEEISQEILSEVKRTIQNKEFNTFLFHSPSFHEERSFLFSIIKNIDRAIILCPEIEDSEHLSSMIHGIFHKKVCLIHSSLSGGERFEAYDGIIHERYAMVVGTMSSILSPLKAPSLIVVLEEHSPFYKQDKSPRYNARDVAVMRGWIEKTPVLLMSPCPSSISYANALRGKYRLLQPVTKKKKPEIHLIRAKGSKEVISDRVIQSIKKAINNKQKAFILINRKGYSMVRCSDCGYIEKCPQCHISLVFHEDRTLRCHRCGLANRARDTCIQCSGATFEHIGAGTQRIEEFIRMKTGVLPLRMDRDLIKNKKELRRMIKKATESPVLVGTKLAYKNILSPEPFHTIAMINPDLYLHIPDYMALERLFQDVIYLSEMVHEKGSIYLQTFFPERRIYQFLKKYDYKGFLLDELNKRKELFYPPYSKMASIVFHLKTEGFPLDLSCLSHSLKIMGPVPSSVRRKGYKSSVQIILMAREKRDLHEGIRMIYEKAKSNNLRLEIDMDPVSLV